MGWNQVEWGLADNHWSRTDISDCDQFYFVHSYRVETDDSRTLLKHRLRGNFHKWNYFFQLYRYSISSREKSVKRNSTLPKLS